MTTRAILNEHIAQFIPDDAEVSHANGEILINGEVFPKSIVMMIMNQNIEYMLNIAYQLEQNESANSGTELLNNESMNGDNHEYSNSSIGRVWNGQNN